MVAAHSPKHFKQLVTGARQGQLLVVGACAARRAPPECRGMAQRGGAYDAAVRARGLRNALAERWPTAAQRHKVGATPAHGRPHPAPRMLRPPADFLRSDCHGCRTLHPKLKQLAANNADCLFIKVRVWALSWLVHWGSQPVGGGACLSAGLSVSPMLLASPGRSVPSPPALPPIRPARPPLPAQVNTDEPALRDLAEGLGVTKLPYFQLWRDVDLVAQFTANISTVQVLRAEIATHKACTDPGCDL